MEIGENLAGILLAGILLAALYVGLLLGLAWILGRK